MATPPYVVSLTSIDSTWGNQVADALVNPFASSAARSSAITTPTTGQVTYLTTNTSTEGIEAYNSNGEWTKPWNMPWGEVGYDELTSDASIPTTTGAISGMSVTFTSVANRRYKVVVEMGLATATNTQTLQFDVYSNTAAAQLFAMPGVILANITDAKPFSYSRIINSPTGGSTTWIVRGLATATGAQVKGATAAASIQVLDLGPYGAPA